MEALAEPSLIGKTRPSHIHRYTRRPFVAAVEENDAFEGGRRRRISPSHPISRHAPRVSEISAGKPVKHVSSP